MTVIQHPQLYEQLIRKARSRLTPQLEEGKAQGLPHEVVSLTVVICEDRKHLMFYADTADEDVTYCTTVEHSVADGESLDDEAWSRAFHSVAMDPQVII